MSTPATTSILTAPTCPWIFQNHASPYILDATQCSFCQFITLLPSASVEPVPAESCPLCSSPYEAFHREILVSYRLNFTCWVCDFSSIKPGPVCPWRDCKAPRCGIEDVFWTETGEDGWDFVDMDEVVLYWKRTNREAMRKWRKMGDV